MKQLIIILLIVLKGALVFAQDAKSDINQGNKLYREKKYKEAEEAYRRATAKKNEKIESNFNLGDALYKQKKTDSAEKNFENIASSSTNPLIKAGAYHNLGNSLLTSKKYDASIDAYKKALLNNPQDDETRYNLAYAQEMLKKQQQKNKNNQNKNNNQNQNNKNNQDKNKNNSDKNKDKNKNDQDKNNQNKSDQDKKDQQSGQSPNKVSKDDAQRMLDALNDQEKNTQEKLKNKKLRGSAEARINKDW